MQIIVPDYYKEFLCIAGECQHNCCVGWEIDIDCETLKYYKSIGGKLGKRLMDNVDCANNTYYFRLSENERCPFLNDDNLCDIILELGKDSLCRICSDHPRYRNFFLEHEEMGLGLCCEAAAKLILTKSDKMKLVALDGSDINITYDKTEQEFFAIRNNLINILQDRNKSIRERAEQMFKELDIKFLERTPSEWAKIYLSLEIMDKSWGGMLDSLKDLKSIPDGLFKEQKWDIVFEQLLVYFLYRHMADGLDDGRMKARAVFGVYALCMICLLYAAANGDFIDIARRYSAEIEYCGENMDRLLDLFDTDRAVL